MMGIKEMHPYIKKERNFFQNTVKNIQILRNTRLMSVSFQSQRKAMQRMLKLPHNCTHLTR